MMGIRFTCPKCGRSLTVTSYRCTTEDCTGLMLPENNLELIGRLLEESDYWYKRGRADYQDGDLERIAEHQKLMDAVKLALFAQ